MLLSDMNERLKGPTPFLDDSHWRQWLWHTDMHEPLRPKFNRSHLLGLVLARHKALHDPADARLGEVLPDIVHPSKKASELTLRQLRDAVEDLQMHWDLHCRQGDGVVDALDALWTRFGQLNLREHLCMDDLASVDPEAPTRMGLSAIRRFVVLFCVLYRHLDLEDRCTECASKAEDLDLQSYHRQAGLDAFHEHAMYADLPPAARITYKQDFAGMYHSITQVLYFHFPEYSRKRQVDLDQIKTGASLLHCLSVALEMRPDVPVRMEDEQWGESWNWVLLSGGKVYLAHPLYGVFTAKSIWQLLAHMGR